MVVAQVLLAVRTCGQPLTISIDAQEEALWSWLTEELNVFVIAEDERGLASRLVATRAYDRLRTVGAVSDQLRRAMHEAGIAVIDAPVLANGRLELRWYLREQAISQTMHRYGNLIQ